jgi:hypothetical protein
LDCSLENKLLHRFDDEHTIKRFNSPDDSKNHLQETLKDVVSASELLFGGFSDWRNRLEKKNQSFPVKVNYFLNQYFTSSHGGKSLKLFIQYWDILRKNYITSPNILFYFNFPKVNVSNTFSGIITFNSQRCVILLT